MVIRHRYGIDECEVQTLEELADSLDLTRERVRQIQLEALGQLRRIIKRRGVSKDVLLCSSAAARFQQIPAEVDVMSETVRIYHNARLPRAAAACSPCLEGRVSNAGGGRIPEVPSQPG
jgi:hypothetical protein